MKVALIGNQNCGKTTLFNRLTGSNQHVGNFPGVTVDSKIGTVLNEKKMELIDLPGIYSLSPYSNEEIVTRNYLIKEKPDAIINILDATNIERNLYLTMQLIELDIPMVIALNMMDEVTKAGNSVDVLRLERHLGVPVLPIAASKKQGIDELVILVKKVANGKIKPQRQDFCKDGAVHRAIHSMMHLIDDHAMKAEYPLRFAATRIIEGDELLEEELALNENEHDIVNHIVQEMEESRGLDREAALADMRYSYIENVVSKTVVKVNARTKEQERSLKIDRILTNKWAAFPIFIGIMGLIFFLTFGVIGKYLSMGFEWLINWGIYYIDVGLQNFGTNEIVRSLIVDGVFGGIGSVLSFLPTIVVLFFFLSMLEDSGYMARIAFVMDKPLRKLGLSGKSFVPMILGFGCTVPAVMATRTLTSERDRKMTIMLAPYMSCSAKLPIYVMLTGAFFARYQTLVMIGLYLIGILVALLIALISKLLIKGKPVPFMMELPAYRLPTAHNTMLLMWDKAKDFVKKAFTIILLASVAIWILQSFDVRFNYVTDNEFSMLASISKLVTPIFKPLGFDDWRITAALVSGLTAKESVVSTLGVLFGSVTGAKEILPTIISYRSAFALLVFILLYMPCVAAFSVISKELKSKGEAILMMIGQTSVAWLVAFLVFLIGGIF